MSKKLAEIGIPVSEITPAVSIAVNGLLDHIEHLNNNLMNTHGQLENLQNLIDVDTSPAIPNKKSFIKRLNWTIQMSKRHNEPSCVVIFKIDNYDDIYSNYGLQAMSKSVNQIAETLSDNTRDTDFLARIGEDEFAAIMFFANIDNARNKTQRLVHDVALVPLFWNNQEIQFNISWGVHQLDPADTPENAMLATHNALFVNKQSRGAEDFNINT